MKKCYKCKGKGYIMDWDWFIGICTFGLTLLAQASDKGHNSKTCDACNGKGYLEEKC